MTNAGCARSMHLQTSPPQSTWRTIYCDPLRETTQCGSGEKSQLGMTTSSPQLSHDDLFTRFPWQAEQIESPISFGLKASVSFFEGCGDLVCYNRNSVVWGMSVSVGVDPGGGRRISKNTRQQ